MPGDRHFLWHGSDRPIQFFGGKGAPDILHLGTLRQADMRCGGAYLHLVEVGSMKVSRIRDRGSDMKETIARARRKGVDALVYLNRYEGIRAKTLEKVLQADPGCDLDALSDAKFRVLFPEAEDSVLLLDPSAARVVGCFEGIKAARNGYRELVTLGGMDAHLRPPAAELTFEKWIGYRRPIVLDEGQFGPGEVKWIAECRERLLEAHERRHRPHFPIPGLESRVLREEEGILFHKIGSDLVAMDADNERFLGGISGGMVYVDPAERGRGVAVALHVCAEETRCIALKPSHFSRGGFAARRKAHRALCQRAFDRGDAICEENRKAYDLSEAVSCEP